MLLLIGGGFALADACEVRYCVVLCTIYVIQILKYEQYYTVVQDNLMDLRILITRALLCFILNSRYEKNQQQDMMKC